MADPEDLLTVRDVARMTSRSEEVIRRYARLGIIEAVKDPSDRRRILIPFSQIGAIMRQPRLDPATGKPIAWKESEVTFSDGTKRKVVYIPIR